MSRTVITTITPFDYTNFKQEFSEKNIINQTSGTEYIIDAATSTNITDINNTSLEVPITPLGGGTTAYCWGAMTGMARGIFAKQYIQGREEYYRHSGTITLETDAIITDTNGISVNVSIDYDKYHSNTDVVTDNNCNGSVSVFNQIRTSGNKVNDSTLTTSEKLPYEHSTLKVAILDFFGGRLFYTGDNHPTSSFPQNTVYCTCKKLPNDHYQIVIHYSIITWWGKNYVEAGKWSQSNSCDLWVATNLSFSVKANTVTAHELEFNYSRNDESSYTNAHGKNYEIDSNEFLQTDENTGASQRQSSILSTEIFEKYDTDRAVVSFTLLNCEKYEIGNETRYLQAEDLIYIEDSDGSLISDDINSNGVLVPSVFEIIKARPIWDGTYSMGIVCRKIDLMT